MSETLLEVKHLKKYFNTKAGLLHAVDDVSFSIAKGETLGLVGESGCGKSTIGRAILRLHEPTSGEVLLDGTDVTKLNKQELRELRRKMQIVFQDPYSSLDGRKSVFESIGEPLIIQKICKTKEEYEKRVYTLMETVGLAERLVNAYPHELDGGRRQRVGIARALALNPSFLVQHEEGRVQCACTCIEPFLPRAGRAGFRAGCFHSGAGAQSDAEIAEGYGVDVACFIIDATERRFWVRKGNIRENPFIEYKWTRPDKIFAVWR